MNAQHMPRPRPNSWNRRRWGLNTLIFGATGAGVMLGIAGCSKPQPSLDIPGNVIGGSIGLSAYSRAISVHADSTGVIFGPMGQPGSAERPRYATLVRYPSGDLMIGGNGGSRNGAEADLDSHTYVLIDQKDLDFRYAETIDESSRKVLSETLTFNGAPVNLAAGNLLLVSLGKAGISLQQSFFS